MLLIFSTNTSQDCRVKLGSVLCQHQDLDILVVQSIAEVLAKIESGVVKAVFCLGTVPLEACQAAGFAPKNRKVTGLRKSVLHIGGVPMMVSYSPSIGEVDHSQFVDLLTDTNLACKLAKNGTTAPEYGDYRYTPDLTPVVQGVKALLGHPEATVPLAFDTETLGLDRFHPQGYVVSLQFSFKKGTAWMVAWKSREESLEWLRSFKNQQDLHWLLNEPQIRLRAANGKYDLGWVYEHTGITCTNFTTDTTLIGSLLDENRSNGLDVHAKIYAPRLAGYSDDFDSKTDKSRMDLAYANDPKKFLNYSAGDADATLEVAEEQVKQLVAIPPLARFYVNILHPAARAFEVVEQGGVFIDLPEFNLLEADLIADLHSLTNKAKAILGGSLVARHFDQSKTGGLNLTKASLITDFMFTPRGLNLKPKMLTEKTKAPVTSMEHLEMFKDVEEAKAFVSLMSEFSSTNKTLSTYINGFRQHIRSDGRFHPSYWLHAGNRDSGEGGTNTGRLSVTDPAFQCCVGSTLVLLDTGPLPIKDIVDGHERGAQYTALTHTGNWRRVVGVYRNGIQPVFKVTTASGRSVTCTANHPWLTQHGFVRTDSLQPQFHHAILCSTPEELQYGRTVQASNRFSGIPDRGQRYTSVQPEVQEQIPPLKDRLREQSGIPTAYPYLPGKKVSDYRPSVSGPAFSPAPVTGSDGSASQGWEQAQYPLDESCMGDEQAECGGHGAARDFYQGLEEQAREVLSRLSEGRSRVVQDLMSDGSRYQVWSEQGLGITDSERQALGFATDPIVHVEPMGEQDTFDLTIDNCHSFVANGVVVHNTIPKHTHWGKRIRRCYNAPPGMLVAEEDYSQGELKVMACLANEDVMIEAYLKKLDLHVVTSSFVAGLTYEEMMALKKTDKDRYDAIRQLGKAGNFGLIYGMGIDGFIEYARISYGVIMDYDKAAEFHAGFFTRYPGLPNYHKAYKAFAHQHGYVMSPLGRRRNLPMINSKRGDIRSKDERRAVNAPVQSTLSDMMLWAIAIQNDMGWFAESPCFGAIHDASYFYVPEDNYEFYVKRSMDVMENLPFHKLGWTPQLKFTADGKAGKNMADLKEVKFT